MQEIVNLTQRNFAVERLFDKARISFDDLSARPPAACGGKTSQMWHVSFMFHYRVLAVFGDRIDAANVAKCCTLFTNCCTGPSEVNAVAKCSQADALCMQIDAEAEFSCSTARRQAVLVFG